MNQHFQEGVSGRKLRTQTLVSPAALAQEVAQAAREGAQGMYVVEATQEGAQEGGGRAGARESIMLCLSLKQEFL